MTWEDNRKEAKKLSPAGTEGRNVAGLASPLVSDFHGL
jgi:hypothetical protein